MYKLSIILHNLQKTNNKIVTKIIINGVKKKPTNTDSYASEFNI